MNADLPCPISKVRSPAGTSVVQSEKPCVRWNRGSAVYSRPRRSATRYAGRKYLKPASEKKLSAFAWPSRKSASIPLQSSSVLEGTHLLVRLAPLETTLQETPSRKPIPRESRLESSRSQLLLSLMPTPQASLAACPPTIVNHLRDKTSSDGRFDCQSGWIASGRKRDAYAAVDSRFRGNDVVESLGVLAEPRTCSRSQHDCGTTLS